MARPAGRRPGNLDTRGQILAAAREEFAGKGYAGATIRGIAGAAEVDPALVHYYFSTKRELFIASVDLPFDPGRFLATALDGDTRQPGRAVARLYLQMWESPHSRGVMQSLLRSALMDDHVLRMLREFMVETVITPVVQTLDVNHPELRASLLASQVIGLAIMRHIVRLEPLASADPETLVEAIAPNLDRYLTGDLGPMTRDGHQPT